MTAENYNQNSEEYSILTLIQKIKDELFDPRLLSKDQRQQCVEVLKAEGLTDAAIAQILKVSVKTISRDLQVIRERKGFSPNLPFVKQTVGEIISMMRVHRDYLMRLARSRDASVSEKVQAEYSAWLVLNQCVVRLQSLGYLPMAAKRIEGDLFHHLGGDVKEDDLAGLRNALSVIETTAKDAGTLDGETEEKIKLIKSKIDKAEIESAVDKLTQKQDNELGGNVDEQGQN